MPTVSVVIPNYNHAKYLDERIQSVLAQTWRDFEVIILDDCSTDNSRDVIERYRDDGKVARIVYNEKNSGSVFSQWRKGISLARGEYIWIAESDDVAEPAFLEKMMAAIGDDKEVALAASSITFIDENGKPFATWGGDTGKVKKYDGHRFIKRFLMYENTVHNASAVVFRKDMAESVPCGYTRMRSLGDYLFWVEMANCGRVIEVSSRLDRYRRHRSSVTFKTENSAVAYSELHTVYQRLIDLGYPSLFSRYNITGMRLWRMRLLRAKDYPELAETLGLWRKATKYPAVAERMYMLYAFLVRMPAKKLNKERDLQYLPSRQQ